jgi:hypothetical protein
MEARGSHRSRRKPSRGAKPDAAEPGMSRANSSVQLQAIGLVELVE